MNTLPNAAAVVALFEAAPWRVGELPKTRSRIPEGCLLPTESRLLYVLGRDLFRGHGCIADCGAFLGRSAGLLAQGVLDNPRVELHPGKAVVHSYDWFRVCDDHDAQFIRATAGIDLRIGDSSRAVFDRNTADWAMLIEVHSGDFLGARRPAGEIEILFLDVCKTPELNGRVLTEMFPGLAPGTSVVVQQDYHHAHHPTIHTSLEFLSEYLEPLATRIDDSYVFRLRRPIPPAQLAAAAAVQKLPAAQQLALMDAAIARLPADERHFVQLARCVLVHELQGHAAGAAAIASLPQQIPPADQPKWAGELQSVCQRFRAPGS